MKRSFVAFCLLLVPTCVCLGTDPNLSVISGKVVDANGNPVSGARVRAFRAHKGDAPKKIIDINEITTGPDGAYSFSCISQKRLKGKARALAFVVAQKTGYATGWADWDLAKTHTADIKLKVAGVLGGTVVDESNQPLAEVKVRAVNLYVDSKYDGLGGMLGLEPYNVLMVQTDNQGKFRILDLPEGAVCELVLEKAGMAKFSSRYFQKEIDQKPAVGRTDLQISLARGARIKGKVIDKLSRNPLANIDLTIATADQANVRGIKPLVSDANGEFIIESLNPAAYNLQISWGGKSSEWVSESVIVKVSAGQTTDTLIEAEKGGLLEIKITDAQGKPAAGFSAGICPEEGGIVRDTRLSDSNGISRTRLIAGKYNLHWIRGNNYRYHKQWNTRVTIENQQTVTLDAEVSAPTVLQGNVKGPDGKPVTGIKITVLPSGAESQSDANGLYRLEYNPDGYGDVSNFVVLARDKEKNLVAAEEISVGDKLKDLVLGSGNEVHGRVEDSNGNALPANIQCCLWAGRYGTYLDGHSIMTGSDGTFKFKAIPSGYKLDFEVSAPGYGRAKQTITFETQTGQQQLEMERFVLERANCIVEGLVVDENELPVEGADLNIYGANQPELNGVKTDAKGRFKVTTCPGKVDISVWTRTKPALSGYAQIESPVQEVKIVARPRNQGTFDRSGGFTVSVKRLKGKPLPDLKEYIRGVDPNTFKGKKMIICFFDMNQRPSRHRIGQLAKQYEFLKSKDVSVTGVQLIKTDPNALSQWKTRAQIPFEVARARGKDETVKNNFGIRTIPWIILTDCNGVIAGEGLDPEAIGAELEKIK